MNHRPFEDWMLDDQPLTSKQERELQVHLRSCTICASIAESNLALHTTRAIAPSAGFAERFQLRLMRWRRRQRWQQIAGTLVLVVAGLATLSWLAGSTIQQMWDSPATLITELARYLVFGLTSFRILRDISLILLRDLPRFIPPVGWFMLFSVPVFLALVCVFAVRRLARSPQGV